MSWVRNVGQNSELCLSAMGAYPRDTTVYNAVYNHKEYKYWISHTFHPSPQWAINYFEKFLDGIKHMFDPSVTDY